MTRLRPFRNGDPPALADLWNRGLPAAGVARPLGAHDFDAMVIDRADFDAEGLLVAERDGRLVGFAHAGFGPAEPEGPSHRLDRELGTVAMLVVDPELDDPELERALMIGAEGYLRGRGASVIYAGGQHPLDPFYRGIYGGSEFAGILSSHRAFLRAVYALGYEPVATTVMLEADLAGPEPRDPRAPLIRRLARVEVVDDAVSASWWDNRALTSFCPTEFRLLAKADDTQLAGATLWEMRGFDQPDGRSRLGLIALEVDPDHRRKGYGRHLISAILKRARDDLADAVAVQTRITNAPALALYEALGFTRVETSTLFRLPAHPVRPAVATPG